MPIRRNSSARSRRSANQWRVVCLWIPSCVPFAASSPRKASMRYDDYKRFSCPNRRFDELITSLAGVGSGNKRQEVRPIQRNIGGGRAGQPGKILRDLAHAGR